MAKFSGKVGYADGQTEAKAGVWVDNIVEKTYFGNVLQNIRRLDEGENLNKDLSVSNQISVVADAYALENFTAIRYVEWLGTLWTVDSVEVQRPRLLLRLGGVYNGPRPTPTP